LERRGGECSWILNTGAASQAAALGIKNAEFHEYPFTETRAARSGGADFAVVDSYSADAGFYKAVSERAKLIVIDDLHDRGVERFAHAVINYSMGARREMYDNTLCVYLMGPGYALLREEYWDMAPAEGNYVLFVPGAADVSGSAWEVAEWWSGDMDNLSIVLGPLVPENRAENTFRAARGKENIEILTAPRDFASLLAGARFVICSASVTAYEALALEKRTAVFSVADNQRGLGEILSGIGAAYSLGDWQSVTPESITEAMRFMPRSGVLRGLINKRGALASAEDIIRMLF
jgi:spore coat polysaccharide biosynthesis predicted glycosyltransferase SpsG